MASYPSSPHHLFGDQTDWESQYLNLGGVLQSTCSRWIWAKYMHPSGSKDCEEQKGLTLKSLVYMSGLVFPVPHLNLRNSSGSSSVTPRPVHTLCHGFILGSTHSMNIPRHPLAQYSHPQQSLHL